MYARNDAVLSECGTYRYRLDRGWSNMGDCVVWVMLNPSTADANLDDHTIRKCMGFSARWGYARMIVVNLFALRSTDPAALAKNTDPIGFLNNWYIAEALAHAAEVIVAWGCEEHLTSEKLQQRPREVLQLISRARPDVAVNCLGRRKDGAPRHPLTLAYSTEKKPWW